MVSRIPPPIAHRAYSALYTRASLLASYLTLEEIPLLKKIAQENILTPTLSVWNKTKSFFKLIEPYHPAAASFFVVSKALWRNLSHQGLKKKIKESRTSLYALKAIRKTTGIRCDRKIKELKKYLYGTKYTMKDASFSYLQLGSLFFPHPGSNVWNSVNNLAGKIASICHHLGFPTNKPIAPECLSPLHATLSGVQLLGITTSLLKQTGNSHGDHLVEKGFIAGSFLAMGIETAITAKNWVQSNFFARKPHFGTPALAD